MMMNRISSMRAVVLTLLLAAPCNCFATAEKQACEFGEGSVSQQYAGFQMVIAPYQDKEDPDFPQCQAIIQDANGKQIFSGHDSGFAIVLLGEDVNGEGVPDVVLEAFSGGAHCCWTYFLISLGPNPGPVLSFENQVSARFGRNEKTGRIEISTWDGAFDYFNGVCHPCSPMPRVFLRLDGKRLTDVSSEHVHDYDQVIEKNRKALTPAELRRLRSFKEDPSDAQGMSVIVASALTIVVSYLYSGREAQARQALEQMWPPFDQKRMWKLILETRRHGILSNTRKPRVIREEGGLARCNSCAGYPEMRQ